MTCATSLGSRTPVLKSLVRLPALKSLVWLLQVRALHRPQQRHRRRLTLQLVLLRALEQASAPVLWPMWQNILQCARHVQGRRGRSALAAKQHFCAPDAKQMIVLEDAKGVPCVSSSTPVAAAVSMGGRLGRQPLVPRLCLKDLKR